MKQSRPWADYGQVGLWAQLFRTEMLVKFF